MTVEPAKQWSRPTSAMFRSKPAAKNALRAAGDFRRRLYEILEHGSIGDRTGLIVGRLIVVLIIINLAAMVLDSVPALEARYEPLFTAIEILSLVVFTVEYALRVWVAVEHAPFRHLTARQARWNFISSPLGVVDLLAVLPFWFAFALPADLRGLLVFRMVRFLKLARYSPAMRSLLDALYRERRALFGCLVILLGAMLFSANIMYLAERHVQPDKLGTIPDAMWWAIVTLGTIGYGDVVPVTLLGRIVATATIFVGLIMVALPIGIVATAFAEEIHRRDFVVTWSMVARVPLFAGLQATDIADIMRLLRARQVEPGVVIARRGEPAHSMYFVAAGEVDIALKHERVRLGAGHFFGEVAALRRARRSATVTALTRTSLLVLDAHDLHALMEREPRIAERIREVVRTRIGRDIVTPKGDLVSEELEEAETLHQPTHGRTG
jgi:voltage-gated potassium channel